MDRHVGRGRSLGSVPNGAILSVERPDRDQEHLDGKRLKKVHQEGPTVWCEGVADGRVDKLKASTSVMVVTAPIRG